MTFRKTLQREPLILTEGSVVERLRRDPSVRLDPDLLDTALLHDDAGREALTRIWRRYLDVGRDAALPMLVLTPTWRATPSRLRHAHGLDTREICREAYRLRAAVRAEYGDYGRQVFIGGLMGCAGDAYRAEEALAAGEAEVYHREQAHALANAGVDLLIPQTLPAFSEALGLARALAATGVPYILSYLVRPTGQLLDGTPLHLAVERIDEAVRPEPLAHMVNCVHPSGFAAAMGVAAAAAETVVARVVGLQANGSSKSPEELDGLDALDSDDPARFGNAMAALRTRFGTRVLGGCCGTDERHLEAIVRAVRGDTGSGGDDGR